MEVNVAKSRHELPLLQKVAQLADQSSDVQRLREEHHVVKFGRDNVPVITRSEQKGNISGPQCTGQWEDHFARDVYIEHGRVDPLSAFQKRAGFVDLVDGSEDLRTNQIQLATDVVGQKIFVFDDQNPPPGERSRYRKCT